MAGPRRSLYVVGDETFAARLRRQRLADELTQGELAERLGVQQQTVGKWERGDRPHSKAHALLVEYLGLSDVDELLALLEQEAEEPEAAPIGLAGEAARNAAMLRRLTAFYIDNHDRLTDQDYALINRFSDFYSV